MSPTHPFWIKVCGIRDEIVAKAAAEAGATAVGFVFAPSPRQVDARTALRLGFELPESIARVGVFVQASLETILRTACEAALTHVQLHRPTSHAEIKALQAEGFDVIQAVRIRDGEDEDAVVERVMASSADWILLDRYVHGLAGGTGRTFDWRLAVEAARRRPIILAGGLDRWNVAEAVERVRPFGVDVSSGVESDPGVKDPEAVRRFVTAAREAATKVAHVSGKEASGR